MEMQGKLLTRPSKLMAVTSSHWQLCQYPQGVAVEQKRKAWLWRKGSGHNMRGSL